MHCCCYIPYICRLAMPFLSICVYPQIKKLFPLPQRSCESSGEKGSRQSLVICVGSCSSSINTTISFLFHLFALTRQCTPATWCTNISLFPVRARLSLPTSIHLVWGERNNAIKEKAGGNKEQKEKERERSLHMMQQW